MKVRKKPVEVEAWQIGDEWFDGPHPNPLHDPFAGAPVVFSNMHHTVSITTLEGTMTASVGDWIIKGVQGEFYPCRPEIFEATYEVVD